MSTTLTATEQRILNAAKTIFYQKGLSGARTHEIAHKAGLNKAMLHYYFRSKERLYQSVLNDSIEQFLPIITNILGHRKLTLQEKIETVIDRYFKLLEEEPKVAYFVINAFNQNPEKINGRISYDENLEYFFDQIHEEINKGNVYFMHPDQLFVNILALITYPYIAEPLIKKLLQKEGREYDRFITQRKKELYHFIINAITPMSQK